MQTNLASFIKDTPQGKEADSILRACVHCGFCTATCPTYNILGDELDGPRGRIYQIKQILEGDQPTAKTQLHLDRCLTCRSCETTCPSGVKYSRLLDIGREVVAEKVSRPLKERVFRFAVRKLLLNRSIFSLGMIFGRLTKPLLPHVLKDKIPAKQITENYISQSQLRKMILVEGCVQPLYSPNINNAIKRLLDRLQIEAVTVNGEACCGSASFHLDAVDEARSLARKNIDSWWPNIEHGAEAIISSASGCGVMIKDYGHLLKDDIAYRDKAERVSKLTKDISEIISTIDLSLIEKAPGTKVAFQAPCTLQHGQKLTGVVESILVKAGYTLVQADEGHFCCGSAGAYSVFQKEISTQLKQRKLDYLQKGAPEIIATANIGCQLHLQSGTNVPVKHWIELLADS